ncbi:MAG: epoxyqueuosine reductase QueH [Proteobacteria bacterium]|nr:epoxyqueuosine reductase QueH [Pseudomonadota bacterium]
MMRSLDTSRGKLLLHTCCGPCATHVIELLSREHQVTAFFYNPNISPEEEYKTRLKEAEKLCALNGTELLAGPYEPQKWIERTGDFIDEPEGGKRCELCFALRLEETARYAVDHGFALFATTLSISPHKDACLINRIGQETGREYGIQFLEGDFKKEDGYRKSCELSRQYGLYRQNYCGCLFSKK